MKTFTLDLGHGKSQIWVGENLPMRLKKLNLGPPTRAFMVADTRLKRSAQLWIEQLRKQGWSVEVRWVRASENLKSLMQLEPLYRWLIQKGADRHSVLFAMGGGTIGDAVGFLAGTYLRGIRWVSVPTTLLAQVDSGLGGKTAVNHPLGKNLIGVFHQPDAVLCDLGFLKSLPVRELISGLGEIIKYGIALDRKLYEFCVKKSSHGFLDLLSSPKSVESLILTCLKLKAAAVKKDEYDRKGFRAVLNWGHTLGHLFEAETGYDYFRHGEAVIWGMRGAVYLSVLQGLLPERDAAQIEKFLSRLPVPKLKRPSGFAKRWRQLTHDKKSKGGSPKFVLLRGIGLAVSDQKVSPNQVKETLAWLHQQKSGVK